MLGCRVPGRRRRSVQGGFDFFDGVCPPRRSVVVDGGNDRRQPVVGGHLTALARDRAHVLAAIRMLAHALRL